MRSVSKDISMFEMFENGDCGKVKSCKVLFYIVLNCQQQWNNWKIFAITATYRNRNRESGFPNFHIHAFHHLNQWSVRVDVFVCVWIFFSYWTFCAFGKQPTTEKDEIRCRDERRMEIVVGLLSTFQGLTCEMPK